MSREDPSKIGLPPKVFLYTVDQIATMLGVTELYLHAKILYHENRDVGRKTPDEMQCRNIAGPDDTPDWRVVEQEFKRWMRNKGFKFYDRGTITG